MNYTQTYSDFLAITGLNQNEYTETQFDVHKVYVIEPLCTKLVDLNSIDLNDADDQKAVNYYGSLCLRKYIHAVPDAQLLSKAGGGTGAVMRDTASQINVQINDLLIANGWTTVPLSGTLNLYGD